MRAERQQETEAGRQAAERLEYAEEATGDALPPGAGPGAWTAFDRSVRELQRSWNPGNHLALRLCHPDGRIRESALNAPHPPPPLVAIRCADWVPAVRERARLLLDQALADDLPGTLGALTPLVLRLARREQGAWARERFEAAIRDAGAVPAVLRDSADLPTRRFAARLSLESGGFGVRELARRAAAEHDPATSRLWTDAALAVMAADGPDDETIDTLLGARIPMVRAAGVTALRGAGRAAEAGDHLADRSGLVRACARWLVRQAGGDPYARYRELVEDPARVTPYAVTGFAECARRADLPLLRALVEHPTGAVRAAAVGGLRLLDSTDHELLRPLLDDPWPAVAREVSLSLRSTAGRLPAEWLAARTAPERPVHTRRAAYRLLQAQGGAAWLRAAVELQTDGDPGLRRLAAQHIQGLWPTYGPICLPARDPEVGALLDRCTGLASGYAIRWMRSQLGIPRAKSTTDGY
ncbi:hypothetical protein J7E99_36005 [Streptomyces sp. ISL-44]|uniref:hypothetical protein n=1 Tax=Streptomyces sp. ISL-44 TaxID=2819184 RepID=UPI001BECBD23|nr:hypothetical protein [Streptomyces sp. ISL-44]MBT2545926.1 hypothetical protein [Streptomyces sp. ISL-44]